jgi:hypothetical protein
MAIAKQALKRFPVALYGSDADAGATPVAIAHINDLRNGVK